MNEGKRKRQTMYISNRVGSVARLKLLSANVHKIGIYSLGDPLSYYWLATSSWLAVRTSDLVELVVDICFSCRIHLLSIQLIKYSVCSFFNEVDALRKYCFTLALRVGGLFAYAENYFRDR